LAALLLLLAGHNAIDGAPAFAEIQVKSGTGFFVSLDGLLVTSSHVITGCPVIGIWHMSGADWTARVVAEDPAIDVAVLAAEGYISRSIAEISRDGGLRLGKPVSTIGFGIRPSKPREPVVTNGKLVGRAIDDLGHPLLLIQARLREGNSGGPVVDADGTLMGMVTGRDTTRPELGIAIPAEAIDTFLKRQGIDRMPSASSGDLPAPTANLLKAVSVLVQCSPSASRGW
jgi:S1-C subfamily serine protease